MFFPVTHIVCVYPAHSTDTRCVRREASRSTRVQKVNAKQAVREKRPAVKINLTAYGGEQVWKFMQYIFLEIVKIQNEVVFQIF